MGDARGGTLRILTWNVHDMLGDPLAVRRVLRAAAADVACLQEAPRLVRTRPQLAALARDTGLFLAEGGRASAGTAILVSPRTGTADVQAFRLPTPGWRTRPRGAVFATVRLPGGPPVRVACVHLGLTPEERDRHTALLLAKLTAESEGGAAIACGDLNERPGGPSWRALGALLRDPAPDAPFTYPARSPRRRIDAVLAGEGVEVVEYAVWHPDDRDVLLASDHRPVLAVVRPR